MTTESVQPAFGAFESQLRTLCLHEFPCGIGTWLESHSQSKQCQKKTKVDSQFSITLKDFGAGYEKTETLQELTRMKKSPWNLDYSWSDDAKTLREIAVKSPWLMDEKFILSHFKTLRIVDKGVTDVDENFLKFSNLKELTLSANKLRTIQSENLPKTLMVLELCANEISNLADLCIQPPLLIHLGLGHNLLTEIDDYISVTYWPALLSLDLSHNNLSDLMEVVKTLQTLPKLRNLLLHGNPLSLVPAYRGYTIDNLRNLDFLDDISISADEKHQYKGLAKRKEHIVDAAKIMLQVDFIKGILPPEEITHRDEQPDYPVITRNYYVEFMFLEDRSANAEIFKLIQDGGSQLNNTSKTDDRQTEKSRNYSGKPASILTASNRLSGKSSKKTVDFVEENGSLKSHTPMSVVENESPMEQAEADRPLSITSRRISIEPSLEPTQVDVSQPLLIPVRSGSSTWQEEIELKWHQLFVREDLILLRNFMRNGMDIAVMEEKILSYPADQVPDMTASPIPGKDKGKNKEKKEDKKAEKGDKGQKGKKQSTPTPTPTPKQPTSTPSPKDDKKKKKKGEPDVELTRMPAEYTTIAKFHIPLEDFLEGEFVFENVFKKSWEMSSGYQTPCSARSVDSKGSKKNKTEKKKDAKEKDVPKNPKQDSSKGGKGKDKDKGKAVSDISTDDQPPPPLEVHVKVRLHHWKTAMDSVHDEQEATTAVPLRE